MEGHGEGYKPNPGLPVQQHELVVTNSALWALANCGYVWPIATNAAVAAAAAAAAAACDRGEAASVDFEEGGVTSMNLLQCRAASQLATQATQISSKQQSQLRASAVSEPARNLHENLGPGQLTWC